MSEEQKAPPAGPPRILERSLVVLIGSMLALSPAAILWGAGRLVEVVSTIAHSPEVAVSLPAEKPVAAPKPKIPAGIESPPPASELVEIDTIPLESAFRFDVTPDWILTHWPRVSAGLAELRLQGYRVPLTTGTREDDIAGSLTYYFTPEQTVQRITFHGTTGNPNRLIAFLTRNYGFVHRKTNHAGLFLYVVPEPGNLDEVRSFLWIRPKQILHQGDRYHRFDLELVIERPSQPVGRY
ncbi:MAG: hypothetical protein D6741_20870 [Planctomycetota bacterium]|nr:MAG: hypothetical protein D6741_20870 [Planctomycetota bacterium]